MRGLESPHQVEFALDGRRIHLASLGGAEDLASLFEKPTDTGDAVDARLRVRVPVKAGPHVVTVAFLEDPDDVEPARLQPYIRSSVDNFDWSGSPHLQSLTITGPFHPAGASDTPSRRRIFVCHPGGRIRKMPARGRSSPRLARRAYRQPLSGADLDTLLHVLSIGKARRRIRRRHRVGAGADSGQPEISVPHGARSGGPSPPATPIASSDFELASRLSFFLWSSIPDDELLHLASEGKLKNPAVLDRQVRRMLADPKAQALVDNFAGQWLQLRNLRNVQPNSDLFPDFDDNLRQSFRRETELLFESVVQEDRSVLDLLTADYTFVNERLARHYGIPDIYGSRFRRVAITDDARRGLLGQGSILALTSHAERTSPVVRGKWILENILGTPVPPPPPDVPPLKGNQEGQKPRTMREQMAEHRANPVCASCHKAMDSIGFAMENFDAVGAWRAQDAGESDRRVGRTCRRNQDRRRGVVAQRAGEPARNCSPGTLTEKAADLRARPRAGLSRHADGARDPARCIARQLSILRADSGRGPQHAVSNANGASRERGRCPCNRRKIEKGN